MVIMHVFLCCHFTTIIMKIKISSCLLGVLLYLFYLLIYFFKSFINTVACDTVDVRSNCFAGYLHRNENESCTFIMMVHLETATLGATMTHIKHKRNETDYYTCHKGYLPKHII